MKFDKASLRLYAVTDRSWLGDNTLSEQLEEAVKSGVTFVQLREKNLSYIEFLKQAVDIKIITDKYNVPLVINDNVDIALACGADGVHIGQTDLSAGNTRKLIGDEKIMGVSVQTVEQAILAEANGADYLGVGAVFTTSTKHDANVVSLNTLKNICAAVSIPVVAIGGIGRENILSLKDTEISGVAIVSAIFSQSDISSATRELKQLTYKII